MQNCRGRDVLRHPGKHTCQTTLLITGLLLPNLQRAGVFMTAKLFAQALVLLKRLGLLVWIRPKLTNCFKARCQVLY